MKNLMFLFLFIPMGLFAQDTINNFLLEDNKIVWQKVFETPHTFDQLIDLFKEKGIFETHEISENKIMGDIKPVEADYEGAGYKRMNTQIYLTLNQYRGLYIIEFREGRYRVTFKNFELITVDDAMENVGLGYIGEVDYLEIYAIRRGEFARQFKEEASIILNYTFENLFTIKKDEEDIW